MTHILKYVATLLVAGGLLIPSAACTINPTITAHNVDNACGGTITVSGNGFTANGEVNIQVLGFWEHQGFVDMGSLRASNGGSFQNFNGEYQYNLGSGEPGCGGFAADSQSVTVMAKDLATGSVTFTTANVLKCPMWPGACPA